MTTQLSEPPVAPEQTKIVLNEQLYCALSGRPITPEQAYWAAPLITARELVTTILTTLIRAPGTLGHVLLAEQPNVPYDQALRTELSARRSAEQLKLLLGMLIVVAVIVAGLLLFALP